MAIWVSITVIVLYFPIYNVCCVGIQYSYKLCTLLSLFNAIITKVYNIHVVRTYASNYTTTVPITIIYIVAS